METTEHQVKLPARPGHDPLPAEPDKPMTSAARCTCRAQWTASDDGPSFAEWALTHQHPRQADANVAADALSELAAFIRTNPDFAGAINGLHAFVTPPFWYTGDPGYDRAAEFARMTRALGGERAKRADDHHMGVTRSFGPINLELFVNRALVCERVVVGTETVEVADPEAPKITVQREIVEWKCSPILANGAE